MHVEQSKCFKTNFQFWKLLGISPEDEMGQYYRLYSIAFTFVLIYTYIILTTTNLLFLPLQMDVIIEEVIFYTTELAVLAKVSTFLLTRQKLNTILAMMNGDIFQPKNKTAFKIVGNANVFIGRCWKIVATVSITSNVVHVLSPVILHFATGSELPLPVCSYSFIDNIFRKDHIYFLYFYQGFGMHVQMLVNVNVDTFVWGLQIVTIAQLDILDDKLTHIGEEKNLGEPNDEINDCVKYFEEINRFNNLFQEIFSIVVFVQFSLASVIICVCLFRFTLPAPSQYYIFLLTYMFIMIIQIFVPCWFGTDVINKSSRLSIAAYKCNWTSQSPQFKSTLRLFVERCNNPIAFIGGKMFPVSLLTFTSIIKSAYSFFTLLRHIQARDAAK